MSLLPQRKKSAEEIAKLRESFGVPGAEDSARQDTPPEPREEELSDPIHVVVEQESVEPGPVPRPVRSLRKSEQLAPETSQRRESPPDSNLPHQRHSQREIEEIRRHEMLALMNAQPNPRLFPAHPALIIPGYLAIAAAAAGIWFYQIPVAVTAACAAASFAIAAVIFIKKPVSRHHAAFIAVLALFLVVFAALYYFPQLRHAT